MPSLEYIDFDIKMLIQESYAASFYSKGGFDFNTLKDLPFDDYEIVIKETVRVKEEQEKNEPGRQPDI